MRKSGSEKMKKKVPGCVYIYTQNAQNDRSKWQQENVLRDIQHLIWRALTVCKQVRACIAIPHKNKSLNNTIQNSALNYVCSIGWTSFFLPIVLVQMQNQERENTPWKHVRRGKMWSKKSQPKMMLSFHNWCDKVIVAQQTFSLC